jgi:hypothetical protein
MNTRGSSAGVSGCALKQARIIPDSAGFVFERFSSIMNLNHYGAAELE